MATKATGASTVTFGFCGGGILMLEPTLAHALREAVEAGLDAGLQRGPDGKRRIRVDVKAPQGKDLLPTFTLVKEDGKEKFLLSVDVESRTAKKKKK